MKAIITNISDDKFSFNGTEYRKTFMPVAVVGDLVRIVNVYDSKFQLLKATHTEDVEVDGQAYSDRDSLISALTDVLIAKTVSEADLNAALSALGEVDSKLESLQNTTARYAFDTLQEAQDKWASFSQEEKDSVDGKEYLIGGKVYKWTAAQPQDADFVRYLPKEWFFDTLSEAQAVDPKPSDGTVFQVSEVTDPDNAGYYSFQSSETEGTRFEKADLEKTDEFGLSSSKVITQKGLANSTIIKHHIDGTVRDSGNFYENSSLKRTDYLPVQSGVIIKAYDGSTDYNYNAVAFYDENKDFISCLDFASAGLKNITLDENNIPTNAYYFISSTLASMLDGSYVYYSSSVLLEALHLKIEDNKQKISELPEIEHPTEYWAFLAEEHPWLERDSEPTNMMPRFIKRLGTITNEHPEGTRLYIGNVANNATLHSWIGVYDDSNTLVAQFRDINNNPLGGIQTVEIKEIGSHPKLIIKAKVDWDKIAHFSGNAPTKLYIDTSVPFTESDYVINDERLTQLEAKNSNQLVDVLPVSPFGQLPNDFKLKMAKMEKDLEILVVGDSIVGQIAVGNQNPNPEQSLPGYLSEHFSFRIWDLLCNNKPVFDRLDSQRGGSDFFTKTGTWSYINDGKLNTTPHSDSGEYSISAGTFQSNDTDAEVQFQIDTDAYEKFNIVHGLHPDATDAVVNIIEGDNQFEVSIDKSNWQEANGFVITQKTESTENIARTGYAFHQRHRRLWFRRNSGVTGVKNISFKKNTSNSDYLYFWGIEKWNGNTIFLTNIGRGGRSIELLNRNITDVIDRNPDLVIVSLPMNNDVNANYTLDAEYYYNAYFYGGDDVSHYRYERSLFFKSNEYQDFSVVAMLPTGRTGDWNGNQLDMNNSTDVYPYQKFKKIYGFLDENNTYENLKVINIYDYIISEAKARGLSVEDALSAGEFTKDGVHLNKLGSDLYVKYLVGLFNF